MRLPGEEALTAQAVVLDHPGNISVQGVELSTPSVTDVLVQTRWSGISSGTERLLYEGEMPPFPGMGYPLVPGYESVGDVIWAGPESGHQPGERVFVAGAACYPNLHALFGGSAARLVTAGARAHRVSKALGANATLLALTATAEHILATAGDIDLIVGHGVLGRLLARLVIAHRSAAAPAPAPLTVWDTAACRMQGAKGYRVCDPAADERRDYRCIVDVSGDSGLLDTLVSRLQPGGVIVLGGFYKQRLSFDFAPAFMRETSIRIAAEFQPEDMAAACRDMESGVLDVGGLLTHRQPAENASGAYAQAFSDLDCLKMILDWDSVQ
ncbi:MAG: chlorophyll synthesis pathway protein BchC [Pseudomonadales bacterium]